MVGGLVEHEQVVVAQHERDEGCASPLPAREVCRLRVQVDVGQHLLDDRAGQWIGRPHMVGFTVQDEITHALAGDDPFGLGEHSDGRRPGLCHLSLVGQDASGEQSQQGRLAVAVATDHADDVALCQPQGEVIEDDSGAVRLAEVLGIDDVRGCHGISGHASRRGHPSSRSASAPWAWELGAAWRPEP